ncbi:MAG: thioredoxin domain-containing protein [Planctomycetaceae bacterium]|nr:thioredoxin domain-containing protein [Planctomycetaceae bacterium]
MKHIGTSQIVAGERNDLPGMLTARIAVWDWVNHSGICWQQVCAEGVFMDLSSGTMCSELSGSSESAVLFSAGKTWLMRGLCVTALGISAYLAWTAFNMQPVYGCGSGTVFDCGHVLTSKWSKVFGLPVSVPAFGLYAAMLSLLLFVRRPAPAGFRRLVETGLFAGFFSAGMAALYFIALQVFVLKHLCWYCLTVHSCGLILAAMAVMSRTLPSSLKGWMGTLGTAGVAGLMTIQIVTPEPENMEIIRYDNMAATTTEEGDGEVFGAPGETFDAPAEEFAPPTETFEPPTDATSTSTESDGDKTNGQPSVASSSLLLILPFRTGLTNIVWQEGTPSPTTAQDGAAKDEAAKDGEKKDEAKPEGEKKEEAPKPEPRTVTVAGNRITLNVEQWPILGSPDAKYIFVEMFDYTCPHCRNTHSAIKGAFEQFGDDLAIVALPVPLESSCNRAASGGGHYGACELGRIAVAVWRADASKFHEFHNWLFEGSRTPAAAKAQAEKLVGADKLRKELDSQVPSQYIKRHVDLYVKVGSGSVPKLMFPNSTVNGEIQKSRLCTMIQQELAPAQK